MDLKIKLTCTPDRLSSSTLTALLSSFTKIIEQSVFESMCTIHKRTSRTSIQKSVYGHVHLDIERVEKGSFILFITGALAGTIASCFYDAVKKRVTRKLSRNEVVDVVNEHLPLISKNLKRDLKRKDRLGSLYVNDIHISVENNDTFPTMSINIKLGLPEKEHMPNDSYSQIDYVIRLQEAKRVSRESR
ncbi:hypothetical protein AB4351_21810 [Vibrio sp. 10N.261.51.F11]|uniref:hypothetical protein n=1 Tax=Vibrio sp. 10N.261.51.F11 TaxID=3229678 RepID=UPI0035527B16